MIPISYNSFLRKKENDDEDDDEWRRECGSGRGGRGHPALNGM